MSAILEILAIGVMTFFWWTLHRGIEKLQNRVSHRWFYEVSFNDQAKKWEWKVWSPDRVDIAECGETYSIDEAKRRVRVAMRKLNDTILFRDEELQGEVWL